MGGRCPSGSASRCSATACRPSTGSAQRTNFRSAIAARATSSLRSGTFSWRRFTNRRRTCGAILTARRIIMVRRLRLIRAMRIATNADETQERTGTVKIAFATEDLKRVDAHFGWAKNFAVYELSDEECKLVEVFQFEGDLKEDGNESKLTP